MRGIMARVSFKGLHGAYSEKLPCDCFFYLMFFFGEGSL